MIEISPDAPEKSILDFVKCWMKLLADDHFSEACALLDEQNCYGTIWTPELIKQTINEALGPHTRFYIDHPEGLVFTNPYELGEPREIEPIEFDDGSGYSFYCDIPLNGEWSDITAQFEFLRRQNGYAVVLHDLHVM